MYIYACIYVYMYTCIYVYMYMCICVYVCICIYVYVCIYMYVCICMYVYVCFLCIPCSVHIILPVYIFSGLIGTVQPIDVSVPGEGHYLFLIQKQHSFKLRTRKKLAMKKFDKYCSWEKVTFVVCVIMNRTFCVNQHH